MSNFLKQIEIAQGLTNFYFNRVILENRVRFHVSAIVNKKAIIFHMEQEHDEWKILDHVNLPWLTEIENQLSDAIIHHSMSKEEGQD